MKTKTILTIMVLILMCSCASTLTPAQRYAAQHSNNNFWDRINGMDDTKLSNIKQEYKDLQVSLKKEKAQDKTQAKIGAYRARIREIKNKYN